MNHAENNYTQAQLEAALSHQSELSGKALAAVVRQAQQKAGEDAVQLSRARDADANNRRAFEELRKDLAKAHKEISGLEKLAEERAQDAEEWEDLSARLRLQLADDLNLGADLSEARRGCKVLRIELEKARDERDHLAQKASDKQDLIQRMRKESGATQVDLGRQSRRLAAANQSLVRAERDLRVMSEQSAHRAGLLKEARTENKVDRLRLDKIREIIAQVMSFSNKASHLREAMREIEKVIE